MTKRHIAKLKRHTSASSDSEGALVSSCALPSSPWLGSLIASSLSSRNGSDALLLLRRWLVLCDGASIAPDAEGDDACIAAHTISEGGLRTGAPRQSIRAQKQS